MKHFYVALIHHPVIREGSVITSSVTNLDIHDISRVCSTYGLGGYFIVHPDEKMRSIASRLSGHWTDGAGKKNNPDRCEAIKILKIVESLEEVIEKIKSLENREPLIVGTTARKRKNSITISDLKKKKNLPVLILFGTAGGIDDNYLDSLDFILEPNDAGSGYNHLSVRSAVSIFIDRLYVAE
jgi:tRNA (guanine37-N1)-methyltransferase